MAAHLIDMGLVVRLKRVLVLVVVMGLLKFGFLRGVRLGFLSRRVWGEVAIAMVLGFEFEISNRERERVEVAGLVEMMNIGMIFKGDIRYESNECVLYLYDILNYILEYILLG